MNDRASQWPYWLGLIVLVALVAALAWWLLANDSARLFYSLNLMAGWVEQAPLKTVAVFLLIFAVSTALTLPTVTILTITGGFLFGSWLGTALSVMGALLGAAITFVMVRRMAGDRVRNFFATGRLAGLVRLLERDAFFYLMGLRIVPVAPFFALNAAGALIRISLGRFLLATVLGLIPIMAIFASVGSGLETLVDAREIGLDVFLQPGILLPLIALISLIIFSAVTRQWMNRRRKKLLGHDAD